MKRRLAGIATVVVFVAVVAPPAAAAATRVVDDDKRHCPTAPFSSIQAAVDAAEPGDTVLVCRGLYLEQVLIGSLDEFVDKSNIRVTSQARAGAIVRSQMPFRIHDQPGIEISRFRLEGPGTGIYLGAARGTLIADNVILTGSVGINQDDLVRSMIRNNLIRDFADAGVGIFTGGHGSGTFAQVRFNTVIGSPGSRGVWVLTGCCGVGQPNSFGQLFGNTIAKNGVAGVDISNGVVDVKANNIFSNGVGLSLEGGDPFLGMAIENNRINYNREQGILVERSSENTFTSNNARGNAGIDCEDRTGPGNSGTAGTQNTWTSNLGHESVPAGICNRTW